jgi:hypothetical protein
MVKGDISLIQLLAVCDLGKGRRINSKHRFYFRTGQKQVRDALVPVHSCFLDNLYSAARFALLYKSWPAVLDAFSGTSPCSVTALLLAQHFVVPAHL